MTVVSAEATAYVSDGGCSGGGGRKLHLNGRTTNLAACLPFRPWPSAIAAAAGGVEKRDLPPRRSPLTIGDMLSVHGNSEEEPKRQQDEKDDGDIGVAHSNSGGNAPAPKRLGAKASEVSVVRGWHKMLPSGASAALAAAEAMVGWSDIIEGEFPPKKRRGRYQLTHGRSLELEEEEEENVAAERDMNPPRPNKSRRRRTAASSTTTVGPPAGIAPASGGIGTGINGGAPSATGDGAGAINKECVLGILGIP